MVLGLTSLCARLLSSSFRVKVKKKKQANSCHADSHKSLDKSYMIFDIGIRLQNSHTEAKNQNCVLLGIVFQLPGIYKGSYTRVTKQQWELCS